MNELTLAGSSISEPLANIDYEFEILASDILSGIIYKPSYSGFIYYLTNLPIISLIGDVEFSELSKKLRDELIDKNNNLIPEKVKALYYNDLDLVKNLLIVLNSKANELLPLLNKEDHKYTFERFNSILANSDNEPLSFNEIDYINDSEVSPFTKVKNEVLKFSYNSHILLEIIDADPQACNIEVPVVTSYKKLPAFYNNLQYAMEQYDSIIAEYPIKCLNLLKLLQERYPQSNDDKYQQDVFTDIHSLMKKPKQIINKLKNLVSIDDTVGIIIQNAYPEISLELFERYAEIRDSLDYQQQLRIEKGLGIGLDSSNLANTCETYLYKGYNEQ